MAGSFLDFMGGIGSTPTPVYGTSAEDVALQKQKAAGAAYWNSNRPSQTGYLPSLTGPSATNTGGAVYPWNSPSQMTPPTYGGTGATRPVQTTTRGGINPATDKRLEHFLASEGRSVAELLAGIGSYGGPTSLSQPQTGLGYAPTPQNPAVVAAEQAVMPPLPRRSPVQVPNRLDLAAMQPKGANPGMGGAIIGNGQMSPMIPPQLPPADGSSPLPVWAGDNPQAGGGSFGPAKNAVSPNGYRYVSGPDGQWFKSGKTDWAQANGNPATQYLAGNMRDQLAAQQRQAQATGNAGGYQYQNGQKVGYAPINVGRGTYTPTNGAAAYALSNLAGQQVAQQRQATATGQTGVYTYVNGQKTGTVGGGTSAQAYERAAARSRDPGTSGEGGNPSWW